MGRGPDVDDGELDRAEIMKLRVSDIDEAGVRGRLEVEPEWLREQNSLGELGEYWPVSSIVLDYEVTRHEATVHLTGEIAASIGFVCTRCGQEGAKALRFKVRELFVPATELELKTPNHRALSLKSEDLDLMTYRDDTLDLGMYATEIIQLALPTYPRCETNPSCAEGEADYNEDWGVSPEEAESNPDWKEGLSQVKKSLFGKKRKPRKKS